MESHIIAGHPVNKKKKKKKKNKKKKKKKKKKIAKAHFA